MERELGLTYHESTQDMLPECDVVTINAPLHPETEGLFDDELLGTMRRGTYLVNTARGKICDRDAIVRALESGQLAGYAGDVWYPQPAPKDHPWRTMPHHGMTPHTSGTSLSAQARYAAGTREILECWFDDRPIPDEYLIVDGGKLAGTGAHSYSAGDATSGSEKARAADLKRTERACSAGDVKGRCPGEGSARPGRRERLVRWPARGPDSDTIRDCPDAATVEQREGLKDQLAFVHKRPRVQLDRRLEQEPVDVDPRGVGSSE